MDRLDPGVREIISIISAHLDDVETTPRLDEYKEGTRTERELGEPEIYNLLTEDLEVAKALHGALKDQLAHHGDVTIEEVRDAQGKISEIEKLKLNVERANACNITPADADEDDTTDFTDQISLPSNSVDLIVTSPPYWRKRDYGITDQLGQEKDPDDYVDHLVAALDRWREFLRPHGSIFLNIGDTYQNKSLVGIPGRFVQKAQDADWTIRNDIIWAKDNGMPSSAKDRLVGRHEHIIHLVWNTDYYYDLHGYANAYGNGSNPGDVWRMNHDRNTGGHLAPFPEELARRAITLACPPQVCQQCGDPRERIRKRGLKELNTERPQARRAIELYEDSDLTPDHLRAIQATGISDAGKAIEIQDGAGANDETVQKLAEEAKEVLGGYFREFTFPQWTTEGWTECECDSPEYEPGFVFDPFAGSGTTLKVANELRYHAWGTDLDTSNFDFDQSLARYQTEIESE
jgi:DNA modification methylase